MRLKAKAITIRLLKAIEKRENLQPCTKKNNKLGVV